MASFVWPSQSGGGSVSGVSSLNGLTGDLTLEAGTGIAITPSGDNLIISTTGAGTGTVTSVGLADGSTTPIYSISGSPVVSAGTLTFTLNTEPANTFFAGPTSGAAAQPTFRAIGNSDLTAVTQIPTLSVTFTQVSGVLPISQGGTGQTTKASAFNALSPMSTQGDLIYEGTATGTRLPIGTSGQVLTVVSGLPVWSTVAPSVTSVSVNTANGFAGTSSGGTTPALTLSTTVTGILQGNGTAISAASTTGTGSVVLSVSPTLTGLTTVGTLVAVSTVSGSNLTAGGHASLDLQASNNLTDVSSATASFNNINPMTTTGDMIYENAPTSAARLPIGTTGEILTVIGGIPTWAPVAPPAFMPPTIQVLSGPSGTYTSPTPLPLYIRIILSGDGGGGSGGGIAGSAGSAGTGSTFSSFLSASSGSPGTFTSQGLGGVGGTSTVSFPGIAILELSGGSGQGGSFSSSTQVVTVASGSGGNNSLGGAGGGAAPGYAGQNGATGTGSGGGGGGANGPYPSGGGGGAGGYLVAQINSPAASYLFTIGQGGAGGAGGANGQTGGNGGSGAIIVQEYYS
jgi:hypothetical protein